MYYEKRKGKVLTIDVVMKKNLIKPAIYIILILSALFFLTPIYVFLMTGLKSFKEVNIQNMWSLPEVLTLDGFFAAFVKLSPNLLNSFLLTIPATIISSILGSLNGYVISKWRFKGANTIFIIMLFGMFIPYQSILIPLVQFLSWIRLYGNLPGLILTHVVYGIPITTLVFRNYYIEIPDSLIEAAQLDGFGIINIYVRIIFPISAPAFVVVIIWHFSNIWNEFLFAVVLVQNPVNQPITVALRNLAGSQIVEWNVQMAGALIAAIPTLIIYILLGKYFIRGLLAGSVKG
jgi:glucose/mannose transport system permease protein